MKVILFFIAVIICSCNNSKKENNVEKLERPSNVVVLCDVSGSISQKDNPDTAKRYAAIRRMINTSKNLVPGYKPGSTITYYIISRTAYPVEIIKIDVERLMKNTEFQQKEKIQERINILQQAIDSSARNSEENTCVLTSIENAYRILATMYEKEPDKNKSLELIILSDMVEECKDSPVGSVYMKTKTEGDILSPEEYERLNNYQTMMNFDSLGINVYVHMVTPAMSSLTSQKIEAAWRMLFIKMHYKKAENPAHILFK